MAPGDDEFADAAGMGKALVAFGHSNRVRLPGGGGGWGGAESGGGGAGAEWATGGLLAGDVAGCVDADGDAELVDGA